MDQDLVVRAQRGDHSAFEALIVRYNDRLFRLAHGILRDRHLAEDATQQAFLDIWRDVPRLRDPARFEGWACRLLVRVCYAESRRQRRQVPGGSGQPLPEASVGDAASRVLDRDELERGFQHLSIDHRAVIVLRYLMDMSPDEVAEVLHIPTRTVYSRLKRAMPAMRAALEAAHRPAPLPADRQEIVR